MSGTTARFAATVLAGAGIFGALLASGPNAGAAPLKTGGYACVQTSAGAVAGPAAPACGPIADMAGIPLALPGPLPAAGGAAAAAVPVPVGAAAMGVPPVPVVPPVPLVPPIVPPVVPPIPPVIPPVPVVPPVPIVPGAGAGALGAPIALAGGAPVDGAAVAGLPIADMSGLGGKGAPVGPPPPGAPADGQPLLPGPAG